MEEANRKFMGITQKHIVHSIRKATKRIYYASPGIFKNIANAITDMHKHPNLTIDVVLDPNPEICRLGYGEFEANQLLNNEGVSLRKSRDIRISLLIVDDDGWLFNMPPLCIEPPAKYSQINGIRLSDLQIKEMSEALGFNYLFQENQDAEKKPEIGAEQVTVEDITEAQKSLEERPPEKFDIKRQVNVYHSYVQFVDLHLDGCDLKRHKVKLPPDFLNLSLGKDLKERIEASLNLLSENSKVSTQPIQNQVEILRKEFLRSAGKNFGNLLLIKDKEKFLNAVDEIKSKIGLYQGSQTDDIQKELIKTKDLLIKRFAPSLKRKPPVDLKNSFMYDASKKEDIHNYLEEKLDTILPKAEYLLTNMRIRCNFKDLTYETLKDEDFQKNIKKLFPHENWIEPLQEYKAIGEKEKE